MQSYLGASYLAGEVGDELTDMAGPTEQPTDLPAVTSDQVRLPGGIIMPRATFNLLLIVVAVTVAIILIRRRKAHVDPE